ncbi:MAG: nuclear transport factor 2 family protein [bacterium]|nr:nuclear transport factor 2 family protein [bacterium]
MTLTRADVITAETAVWEALRNGDRDADRALLAEDFVGVYPTGFVTREDHLAEIAQGPSVYAYEFLETKVLSISPEAALIAYRVWFQHTRSSQPVEWMVSSLWELGPEGRLVNTFSQDTPMERAPASE